MADTLKDRSQNAVVRHEPFTWHSESINVHSHRGNLGRGDW